MTIPDPKASPCIAATTPSACAFSCRCNNPKCECIEYCKRHADAILAHRAKPKHKLHDLALSAYHPSD